MRRLALLLILTALLLLGRNILPLSARQRPQGPVSQTPSGRSSPGSPESAGLPATPDKKHAAPPEPQPLGNETKYLAFQVFTSSLSPLIAMSGEGLKPLGSLPEPGSLRDYIKDIKTRIGRVGDVHTRLAVVFGPLSFDHTDAEITRFIHSAFDLALDTDVAVGFHIDDSIFWAKRKDLWSDPRNVEALDWEGTPNTGRRLDWSKDPSGAPPQMCFNSKMIQQEVQRRSTLIGQAIQAGVKRLQQHNRPELFAAVIAGWETMIGQDFNTSKFVGYRALLNRGFTRAHPPQDMNLEREKVVQEFIEHWTEGLVAAGVSPQKIYSHTAFISQRAFDLGDNKNTSFSQFNHFAPPSVAFGKNHRPGFSTYPQPGLFDEIYMELVKHKQVGWASSEGTNLQLGTGPGQSGMNMETYLAKMFNHGASLVTIFSWGIGGEANKNMSFRVVTEGNEALQAYRKFLKGLPLVEGNTDALTLMERLPTKIHYIQKELPAWVQKTGNHQKATALMQELQKQLDAKNFEAAEKATDAIIEMMGLSDRPTTQKTPASQ